MRRELSPDHSEAMPLLNRNQKRGLSITLRVVEEALRSMEMALNQEDYRGILYNWKNDIPEEVKDGLATRFAEMRRAVEGIARSFSLGKQERKASDEIFGKLPYCWQILVDVHARRLKRYGEVAEGLEGKLDPLLDKLIDLVRELEDIVREVRKN